MSKKYTVSEDNKKGFASIYLLEKMINKSQEVPLLLSGNDKDLEPILEFMMMKEYVEIKDNEKYIASEKGRELLSRFVKRYEDFLQHFDIFCAVDLEEGTFAFEKYFEYMDYDSEWQEYLDDERWDDLRISVAEFKKIDPVEIVFMSFLNEDRFGKQEGEGWQYDLLLGTIWDEIIKICDSALTIPELGYEDDEGKVEGEDAIKDIIEQGARLNLKLKKKEEEMFDGEEEEESDCEDDGSDKIYPQDHDYVVYEEYYDPYYISPWWGLVLFL